MGVNGFDSLPTPNLLKIKAMNNALSEIANLPETEEEVKSFVTKAIKEVRSGQYDKQHIKKKLHYSAIAFRMIRNSIG